MKQLCILFLLFRTVFLSAQSITGFVIFEADGSSVPYASVVLKTLPDSNLVTGGITLMSGQYSFDKVKPGNYMVGISYMGYSPASTNIDVHEGDEVINADTLFLREKTYDMEEVVVKGDRLQGQELVDRTVYTVPDEVAGLSNNGYDILKLIPQVQVDFQNNVTLNGSSNFIIEIDGKQRDKEFLARLQPGDIKVIEIISNPSGKYEGNIDGVISIILKKEARYGINGNLSAYVKPIGKPTAVGVASMDYGMGDITFYATAFAFTQEINVSPSNSNEFLKKDSLNVMNGSGNFKVGSTSINTGFDWYVDDYNSFSFNFNSRPIRQDTKVENTTDNYLQGQRLNYFTSDEMMNMRSGENSVSLFYKKSYKKPIKEFTVEASYYTFNLNDENSYLNTIYSLEDAVISEDDRSEFNDNKRNYSQLKVNYVHPVGMSAKLEGGYQFYYQDIHYDFTSSIEGYGNLFEYTELRNAVYTGFTLNKNKLGIQGTLRVENSRNTINKDTESDYFTFLPSANLQYKFSAAKNLKFTYNRRIDRPGIYDLNPYQKVSSTYTLTEGNPFLEPGHDDRLQLTFTWNFKKNYVSPYVYYLFLSKQKGNVNRLVESPLFGNTTFLTKPFNIRTGEERGGGLNALLWYVNINASMYQGVFDEYKDDLSVIPSYRYSSYRVQGSAFYKFEKIKLTAFTFLNYNGVQVTGQNKTYNMPIYGFGCQKEWEKHNVGFFWLLPFSTDVRFNRTITETPDLYGKTDVLIDLSYFIQFIYSYKFNKGKSVKKLNRKVNIESDSKSAAIGQ